jgi:hypothetical protein
VCLLTQAACAQTDAYLRDVKDKFEQVIEGIHETREMCDHIERFAGVSVRLRLNVRVSVDGGQMLSTIT